MPRHILRLSTCALVTFVVLLGLPAVAWQDQAPAREVAQSDSAGARRVTLYDGAVSFVPPEGFTRLSEEIVAIKFPEARTPGIVYGNERANVTVAITFPPERVLRPEQLPEFKSFMESFLEKQRKDMRWLKKEIVEINSQKWIHFEFTSLAADATIHNHMYLTSADERMLMFNFNSTVAQYERHRELLERSRDTIQLKRQP